ncbi:MAG TPA: hypothetical protein DCQ28_04840 [Bacteroidetes bacterium]|nr:hypothetical protein [Bacteroidota bacterium]
MKSAGRNILFFLLYVSLCLASENKPVASNREILFALSDSVISKIIGQQLQHYSSITIKLDNDTLTTVYRQRFINGLVSKNITVFENKISSETTLELSVHESSVYFGEIFTESFFSKKMVERTVRLSVSASFSSSIDGRILWSKLFSESMVDTVNFADIEHINNSSIPITSFHQPELSFIDSVLEPAIVIFSTGVAVYLFFTIRS